MTEPCRNPACPRAAVRRGLCWACYHYERRTGQLRPEATIVANGQRQLQRELEARAWGVLR